MCAGGQLLKYRKAVISMQEGRGRHKGGLKTTLSTTAKQAAFETHETLVEKEKFTNESLKLCINKYFQHIDNFPYYSSTLTS